MTGIRFSILSRFMAYVGSFLLIIIGLTSVIVVTLKTADRNTIEIEQRWLEGATILGNIDYAITAFRLAEIERAVDPHNESHMAEATANEQRQLVNSLLEQYIRLPDNKTSSSELLAFQNAWSAYQAAHNAWVAEDVAGLVDKPAYTGSALDQLYHAADSAIDSLIDRHRREARALAENSVHRLERWTIFAVSMMSGAAVCLAVFPVYSIRRQIVQPLVAITGAISMLAAGTREVLIPKVNRQDEISDMAAACEVFRINMLALDRVHGAKHAAEQQFTALFSSSVDAIMILTAYGIVTNMNPAAELMFGYSARELIGQPIPLTIPPEQVDEEIRTLAQIRNGENVENFETIRRRKNGELFPASIALSPIRDASGTITGISKIARDITEQKQAERELRQHRDHLADLVEIATAEVVAIVETSISGIVTFDAGGIIGVFNPSAEKLFGWSKAEIAGQNISVLMDTPFALLHGQDLAGFQAASTSNGIGKERKVVAHRKDGSIFPARFSVGYSEPSGGKHFFVGSIVDISEQKQVEQILQQAKEEAEAGGRAKAAFIANMSHEIRTPMNAILGFAEIVLQDAQLPAQAAEHVRIILGSAKALLTILNDILDVSKMESGKVALETIAFHLPNALNEALRLVEPQATGKGLNLVLEYDAALPVRCLGDPTRLRQVVLNLVGNALKFTRQGGVTLAVKPGEAADMLHFAITDTGIGMTPEQVSGVFERFFQADASTTRRFGGTGLGTMISKQIVGLMGGKIWVESEYGRGSVFHFTAHLPAAATDASCLYEDTNAIADDYVPPRCFNVLLAEDVDTNATLAMLRLRRLGHRVDWCKNGMEAVAAYQTGHYDLILMDIMMPVMNGLDATQAIRKLEQPGARIPIIALTASAMREDYNLCTAAGMDQVQAKPIDFNALLAAMENAVPAGRGWPNTVVSAEIAGSAGVDFSGLDGIADHRGALANWRDPAVYAKALADFATEHAGDAVALENLLRASPDESSPEIMGNAEPARALAHALKGVAGNLGITQLAGLAGNIETRLKAGQRQAALAELAQLRGPLAAAIQAIQAIHGLGTRAPPATSTATVFEPAAAIALLGDFSEALKKRNPYGAEPILARLAEYLPKADLAPLHQQLDAFDFKGAQANAKILAETLARQGD